METKSYTPKDNEMQEAYEKALANLVAKKLSEDGFEVEMEVPVRVNDLGTFSVDIIAAKDEVRIAYIISSSLYQLKRNLFTELVNALRTDGFQVKFMLHKPPETNYRSLEDVQRIMESDTDIENEILDYASSDGPLPAEVEYIYVDVIDVQGSFHDKSFTIYGTAAVQVDHKDGVIRMTKDNTARGWISDLSFEFRLDLSLDVKSDKFELEDFYLKFL